MNATLNSTTVEVTLLGQMIPVLRLTSYYIALIVLIPSGLLGNVISVIVYSRKTFRDTAMGKYLIAQSISDFFFQTYGISIYIVVTYGQLVCQITWVINVGAMIFNSLMKTAVSVDRLILVRFPTKCHFIKKTWFQCGVIGTCFIVAYVPVMAAQSLIKYDNIRNGIKGCFVFADVVSQTAITVSRYSNLYLGHLMPFIAMTVCGVSILRKIFEMKSKSNKSSSSGSSRERILTVYTVSSIAYFLILSFLYIGVLFYQLYFYNPKYFEAYFFAIDLGHLLRNIEINTSFFFYLVFNKLYRGELLMIARNVLNIITCRCFGESPKAGKGTHS